MNQEPNTETKEAAEQAASKPKPTNPDVIVLSNGVKLGTKKVPGSILMDILVEFKKKEPKPPVAWIPHLERNEENRDDPDYREALQIFQMEQAKSFNDLMIGLGTKVLSIPKNMPTENQPELWADGLESVINVGQRGSRQRYMAWMKTVVLTEEDDISAIMKAVGRKSGVRQEDVAAATQFPASQKER